MSKLLKYNLKAFRNSHIIFYVVLLTNALILLVANLLVADPNTASRTLYLIINFLNSVYSFTITGVFLLTFILSILYFKRKVLGDEAYLTHTLPVTNNNIINAHLLNTFIYFLIDIVVVVISFLIFNTTSFSLPKLDGFVITTVILSIILVFIMYMLYLSYFYLSLSIGYSKPEKKVKSSIVAGVIIYLISQACNVIMIIVIVTSSLLFLNFESIVIILLVFAIIFYLSLFIVSYTLINSYTKNKLNLE